MKSAAATARRLLDALENFVMQERLLLRAGHFAQMAAVQRRAAPVLLALCQLGGEPGVVALAGRVSALLARRRENLSGLTERHSALTAARERVAARRQRLQCLTPYRRPEGSSRVKRLNAAV
jgi:hypothetical protein